MEENTVFVIFDKKNEENVKKKLESRSGAEVFIFDDISKAKSVIYFESSAAEKNPECQKNLKYAEENNLEVETVHLGGGSRSAVAIVFLVLFLGVIFYLVVFKNVPNVIGSERNQAAEALDDKKFTVKTEYAYSDEYSAGIVFDQSIKEKYMPLLPVTISVSLGKEENLQALPDVTGMTVNEGVQKLKDSGFKSCRIEIADGEEAQGKPGTIISQFIPGGYEISADTPVEITAAAGDGAQSIELNGKSIVLPSEPGATVDIDFAESHAETTEAYAPQVFEDAEYLYTTVDEPVDIYQLVYNKPVVINGENKSGIIINDSVLNNDIILQTGNNSVFVYIGGKTDVKGMIYIDNNIMQTDENTLLPVVHLYNEYPVEIIHGSVMIIQERLDHDIYVDGECFEYEDIDNRIDLSVLQETYPDYIKTSTEEEPNYVVLIKRWENGELLTIQGVAYLKLG